MKRMLSLIVAFTIMLSLCACHGGLGSVNLKDAIEIPEDGIISAQLLTQIKNEKAICVFKGQSNGIQYEWTIFGSDIGESNAVNLSVDIEQISNGDYSVTLSQTEPFGFSALLSIYLEEAWDAQSATAYSEDKAVASVSLTGSKSTILNVTLDGTIDTLEIRTDDFQEDKPDPVEPENQEVDMDKAYTCTFSIECSTVLNNLDKLVPEKLEMVPSGGVVLAPISVVFYDGESVFDVLQRVCKENGIHLESSWTPLYNSAYIEGMHNLYEFDCGALSGWTYRVNGWYPNYGCSRYQLKDGDVVEWRYTCDLGNDVGGKNIS